MTIKRFALGVGLALGLSAFCCDSGFGAIAQQGGGSGYSGKLSSNRRIRQQQLICDPASGGSSGAPVGGSTSVTYDPQTVTVTGIQLGQGYSGRALVEVTSGSGTALQDLVAFLDSPAGTETGYVQVFYHTGERNSGDDVFGAQGQPGQLPVASGFTARDEAGVSGFDTHAFLFGYLPGIAPNHVTAYTIYADPGSRPSGNSSDSLSGIGADGQPFTLGPGQLSPATVRASLVPLVPGALTGSVTLAGIGLVAFARRRLAHR